MVEIISEYWYLEMLLPGIFEGTMECLVNTFKNMALPCMLPCKIKIVQVHILVYVHSKDIQMPAQHYTTGDTAYLPNNFHLSLPQRCE